MSGEIHSLVRLDELAPVIAVHDGDSILMAQKLATTLGLGVGISSGATLAAIRQKLDEVDKGVRILGFNYDTGERYLSVPDFLPTE